MITRIVNVGALELDTMFPVFVSFEPKTRLSHLEEYVRHIHMNLPFDEARIQILRCRLVAYRLAAEIGDEKYNKEYVDNLMAEVYRNLRSTGREITDPYLDPCASQYLLLEELKTYVYLDPMDRFMRFIRAEFKKLFIPTLFILTELCKSEKKYSWEEVKSQLTQIMRALGVEDTWTECDEYLQKYRSKVAVFLEIEQ